MLTNKNVPFNLTLPKDVRNLNCYLNFNILNALAQLGLTCEKGMQGQNKFFYVKNKLE